MNKRVVAGVLMCVGGLWTAASCASSAPADSVDDTTSDEGGTRDGSRSDGSSSSDDTPGDDDGSEAGNDGGSVGDEGGGAPIKSSACPKTDDKCPANSCTQTTFVNLAPPRLSPLDRSKGDPLPTSDAGGPPSGAQVPAGWNFYAIPGAVCRDGSQNGIFVRFKDPSKKLLLYLEGGGACSSPHFCDHNPQNLYEVFPGGADNGQYFSQVLITAAGLQAPAGEGIFDDGNPANPFKDWNQVYVPYCTGDVHMGTRDDVNIPDSFGNARHMHFMGYPNMQKFVGHLMSTFTNLDQIVLTGASAGGLGSGMTLGLVQDGFGSQVPVSVMDDSGPPFIDNKYLPACLQKQYRTVWGLDKSFPSDCKECTNSDGSGLTNIVFYWHHKYPKLKLGLISTLHDQIIRLFFSAGADNCATDDPNILSGLAFQGADPPKYPGSLYEEGLMSLRQYACTNAISTYYIGGEDSSQDIDGGGTIDTLHQHVFRKRFYDALAGDGQPTLAQWAATFASGKVTQVGP